MIHFLQIRFYDGNKEKKTAIKARKRTAEKKTAKETVKETVKET